MPLPVDNRVPAPNKAPNLIRKLSSTEQSDEESAGGGLNLWYIIGVIEPNSETNKRIKMEAIWRGQLYSAGELLEEAQSAKFNFNSKNNSKGKDSLPVSGRETFCAVARAKYGSNKNCNMSMKVRSDEKKIAFNFKIE